MHTHRALNNCAPAFDTLGKLNDKKKNVLQQISYIGVGSQQGRAEGGNVISVLFQGQHIFARVVDGRGQHL